MADSLFRFGDLNVAPDPGSGRTPHKPLLLLAGAKQGTV